MVLVILKISIYLFQYGNCYLANEVLLYFSAAHFLYFFLHINYLTQILQRYDVNTPRSLVSQSSRKPSSREQRKNLQTSGLLIDPTYWIPFLELVLLMIRSLKKVCLSVCRRPQWAHSLQGNGGRTSSISSLSWGSLSLEDEAVLKLSTKVITLNQSEAIFLYT